MRLFPKEKNPICCFQLGKKWFPSLMRIPSGIFWHCRNDETFLILVPFCIFKEVPCLFIQSLLAHIEA